ncbi:Lys-63-specific deubiquitinase BRCC36 [Heterocephalus glaber]|uniref:Lys-63-specific deubiquitinase BRCC36 n=1 Tax=Heterocephalus glaber TaxID=10181 RepID=G5B9D8_HETGA|nr:Lys-63-specific deubiquitinase BRCC36 [Heterocephalus glaber]
MAVQVVQAVQAVHLESDAFLVCLNHALSTEKEEVMGLCIGELNDDTRTDSKFAYTGTEMGTVAEKVDTVRIIHIHSVIILRRSDKRKDRVEISPEQLSAASTEAEISLLINKKLLHALGLLGYTDLLARTLDYNQGFKAEENWLPCRYERIEIPIHIVPHVTIGKVCLESAVELPKILCQEEQDAYRRIHSLTHLDSVTKIHNGSVFTKNLCSQMSAVSGPLLQWLEDRLEQNQQHLQDLQQEKEELLQELSSLD